MNDELTTRLSRQLHDQVDHWQDAPLTLDGVRGRARSIRRTRRVVAGTAVAAVLAIAAPAAVLATGGLDAGPDRQLPPATNTPDRAEDTAVPDEEGSGVGVAYLTGRTLTMPDGTQTELPVAYDGVTVLGERVLGTRIDTDTGDTTLDRIDSGEVVDSVDLAGFGVAPNADGTAVAYVRADGGLVVEWADGSTRLGDTGPAQPVRLLGEPGCPEQSGGCVVFLDRRNTPFSIDSSGEIRVLPGEPLAVEDASGVTGRVALLTSVDDLEPGSCSRVVGNDGSQGTVFETCDHTLDRFSPTGSYLSAGPSYRSGIGDAVVAIVDGESGEQLARYEPQSGFVHTSVWEDSEHLLTLTHDWDAGTWSVVRLGADGSEETVLGPEPGSEMEPPWRLIGVG